jgi:hypothetical protein
MKSRLRRYIGGAGLVTYHPLENEKGVSMAETLNSREITWTVEK